MIDPIIFTIRIGNFTWPVHWYGVIVVIGMFVGAWIVERELKRRGENSELIWDALVWVLIPGIIGARLWFVVAATMGGVTTYTQNPIEILKTWNGGLHIYGGLFFGAIALVTYLRWNKLDPWLFLDAAGPAVLVGQAIGRIANFINQELYGPPTDLPWGIPIDFAHRLPEFEGLGESVRFHPTFAYEMLWNFAIAGFLIWLSHRYEKDLKPGALFAGWLILAGIGRLWIEFFRPDQPRIEALNISYTSIAAALMALTGAVMLMVRYKVIKVAEDWEEEYQLSTKANKPQVEAVEEKPVEEQRIPEVKPVKKTASAKPKAAAAKKTMVKKAASTNKAATKKTASKAVNNKPKRTAKKPVPQAKKSSQ